VSVSARSLLAIFALALAIRLAWVATLAPTLVWPDEEEFVTVARHLAAGDGYVSGSYRATPILPVYLASVFRVAGESYAAARVGQVVMGAVTCIVIAATAARLFGADVGIVSGLLLALYLPHVYLSGVFYAECLFTLLLALTVYAAVRSTEDPHPGRWTLATGVSFALATLTRPILLVYLPFLALALAYAARLPLARRLGMGAVFLVVTALVILPWTFATTSCSAGPSSSARVRHQALAGQQRGRRRRCR
jgi:4-amino-4-deoxy-L-arabinose transferase-like glycosyltransferase